MAKDNPGNTQERRIELFIIHPGEFAIDLTVMNIVQRTYVNRIKLCLKICCILFVKIH